MRTPFIFEHFGKGSKSPTTLPRPHDKKFGCDFCDQRFGTAQARGSHLSAKHPFATGRRQQRRASPSTSRDTSPAPQSAHPSSIHAVGDDLGGAFFGQRRGPDPNKVRLVRHLFDGHSFLPDVPFQLDCLDSDRASVCVL